MIIDKRLEFADATALNTGAPASFLIGNVVDLGAVRDVGLGDPPLYLIIRVDTTVTSGGAATVQFSLASDAQAAIAVDGTQTVHAATGPIGKATLVAGFFAACLAIPGEGAAYERFLGVIQTTGVAALTAGKIDAYIAHQRPNWKSWPDTI